MGGGGPGTSVDGAPQLSSGTVSFDNDYGAAAQEAAVAAARDQAHKEA
jgi:hypothetical protein